jgi:hypothetical protein
MHLVAVHDAQLPTLAVAFGAAASCGAASGAGASVPASSAGSVGSGDDDSVALPLEPHATHTNRTHARILHLRASLLRTRGDASAESI